MQLWQNQHIVDVLNQILMDYDYLEYDEDTSKQDINGIQDNGLHVKVIHQNINSDSSDVCDICGRSAPHLFCDRQVSRNSSDACDICERLGQMTGRLFYPVFFSLGSNHQDRIIPQFNDYAPIFFHRLDDGWISFDIYEHRYR